MREESEPVFCPNCGTKNDDALEKCTQCGFDLQAKKAPAKFKGTMMMQGGANPLASAGITGAASPGPSAKPSAGALKGTMVGVAPPNIAELRQQMERAAQAENAAASAPSAAQPVSAPKPSAAGPAAAPAPAPARPSAAMKGTMVGVAPPGVEELRRQASLAGSVPASPAPASPEPSASKAQMKGTMIGIAPPNIAELRKQLDAASQAASAPAPAPAEPHAAPSAPSVPNVAAQASSATPSRLKGTMIGVAPPDVSALLEKAKAAESSTASDEAPADVNAFGGTVVGTSPFAPGGEFATAGSAAGTGTPDPNGHTVPSPPPDEPPPDRRSDRPEAFASTSVSATAPSYDDRTPAAEPYRGAPEAPSAFTGPPPRPKKGSNGAVIVLSLSIVIVLGLILLLVSR